MTTVLSQQVLSTRKRVAAEYLKGQGIEIGALHWPLETTANVCYVDRLTVPQLREQYPQLADTPLTQVDVVDDGERLDKFCAESLDFIIANHMIEHCENPLGTMRVHLAKLKPGGILYYAIPDKRCCFDVDRPITSFDHLVEDDKDGGKGSRAAHYLEWARLVNHIEDPAAAEENAALNILHGYSIHFHVWDPAAWSEFLANACDYLGRSFEIQLVEPNESEVISVLRRCL